MTARVAGKGEVGHVPEGGGKYFDQDPEGGTVIVAYKEYPNKSGYLHLGPGGFSTINWRILTQ